MDIFFYSASTGGFYTPSVHGDDMPSDVVQITRERHMELLEAEGKGKVIVPGDDGHPDAIDPPLPTDEQVVAQYRAAIQHHMDTSAAAAGYDDIKTAVTYADEPAVKKFQAEGKAFRAWRSKVWDYSYAQLDAILAGDRERPTLEDFVAELPALVLPQ